MSMTQPDGGRRDLDASRPPEPSMEEILASIRAIITDDRDAATAKAAAASASASAKPATGPQIIYSNFGQPRTSYEPAARPTPSESPPAPAAPANVTRPRANFGSDPSFDAPRPAPSPPPRPAPSRPAVETPLLSREAERATSSSFQSLSTAVAAPDPRRIDEMAREMLRPLLKTWLDENLPPLVERLVKSEIERIARGRLGGGAPPSRIS